MRIPLFIRALPFYLVIGLVFAFPYWQHYEASHKANSDGRLAQTKLVDLSSQASSSQALISGYPDKIVIPSVGIDLGIVNGVYNPNTVDWSVAPDLANYAVNSAQPNNLSGQTYIYGHWSPQVFGPTVKLVPGDIAYVYTTNGHVFSYKYLSNSVVMPTSTATLTGSVSKPSLLLMTCQGTWAQQRRFMYFNLVGAA